MGGVIKAVKNRVIDSPVHQAKGIAHDVKGSAHRIFNEGKSQVMHGRPSGLTANLGGVGGKEPSIVKLPLAVERNVADSVIHAAGRFRAANRRFLHELSR